MKEEIAPETFVPAIAHGHLVNLAVQLGIAGSPFTQNIINAFAAGGTSFSKWMAAQHRLRQHAVNRSLFHQKSEPDPSIIPLGRKRDRSLWGIRLANLVMHVFLAAKTGAGKTWTLFLLMIGIHDVCSRRGIRLSVLALDPKRDLRRISNVLERYVILTRRSMKWNFLAPPRGVDSRSWQQLFCQLLAEVFGLVPASHSMLLNVVRELCDIYDRVGAYPTILDLHDLIEAKKASKETPVAARNQLQTLSRTTLLLVNQLGPMMDCSEGITIEQILRSEFDFVIELDGLSPAIQQFVFRGILWSAFHFNLANNQRDLRNVIIIDEAEAVLSEGG